MTKNIIVKRLKDVRMKPRDFFTEMGVIPRELWYDLKAYKEVELTPEQYQWLISVHSTPVVEEIKKTRPTTTETIRAGLGE